MRFGWLLAAALALPASAGEETVRVFAAASLGESFEEIARAFERARPGPAVELNLAGTQVLRTQIEHGAEADVFASADEVHAAAVFRAGLADPLRPFARNRLVVAVPALRTATRVSTLRDLARPGTKVVLAAPTVPAGRYAREALAALARSAAYGTDYRERVEANVVSHEASVRSVLSKVMLGEADAGFVYRTDALWAGARVRTIALPEEQGVVAAYAIARLTRSRVPAAQAFVEFVLGREGQAILRKHGFEP